MQPGLALRWKVVKPAKLWWIKLQAIELVGHPVSVSQVHLQEGKDSRLQEDHDPN
jgi:hypothetical protein